MNFNFGIILAETSRSKAYLNALLKNDLKPSWILLLEDLNSNITMPGSTKEIFEQKKDINWDEVNFDPNETILNTLKKNRLEFVAAKSNDINSKNVINLIKESEPEIIVYSGYGGAILRKEILDLDKKFLHIHGGYLPEFKGSTTNYFSLLKESSIGASAIYLTEKIDCGPILERYKVTQNFERDQLDHFYDSAIRSRVLVKTLKNLQNKLKIEPEIHNSNGQTYYIIHPVLKHIAILGN